MVIAVLVLVKTIPYPKPKAEAVEKAQLDQYQIVKFE